MSEFIHGQGAAAGYQKCRRINGTACAECKAGVADAKRQARADARRLKSDGIKHGTGTLAAEACIRRNEGVACVRCTASVARFHALEAAKAEAKARAEYLPPVPDPIHDPETWPHGSGALGSTCACIYCVAWVRVRSRVTSSHRFPERVARNTRLLVHIRATALAEAPLAPHAEKQKLGGGALRTAVDYSFLDGVAPGKRWQARVDHFSAMVGTHIPKAGE